MAAKFGTSGLRGLATELVGGVAFAHVQAFAQRMLDSKQINSGDKVYMAQDHRASSPDLALETAGALQACGLVPVDCGNIPTPALALYAMSKNAAAIMVTGSHIPADRNGIKFYRPDGEIDKADEAAIVAGAADILPSPELSSAPIAQESERALQQYFARYAGILPKGCFNGQKIGVYQHSSVARDFLAKLLAHFGAEVIALERSNQFVPVDTEAVDADVMTSLATLAQSMSLNAIVSTDADADRPLVFDEHGTQIRGDVLGIITAKALGADFVAAPITSNSAIASATGAKVEWTTIGSPFVISAMEKAKAAGYKNAVGFEPNGGFLIASDVHINGSLLPALMTRDSTLPILMALNFGAGHLSNQVASLNLPVVLADRLQNFATQRGLALVATLNHDPFAQARFVAGFGNVLSIDTTDGLRMTMDSGNILHLRPSGNAPEMRCYVEGKNTETARSILFEALSRIAAFA